MKARDEWMSHEIDDCGMERRFPSIELCVNKSMESTIMEFERVVRNGISCALEPIFRLRKQ